MGLILMLIHGTDFLKDDLFRLNLVFRDNRAEFNN